MQELIQLTINGLATAAMLALPAVSFSLVFAVLRLLLRDPSLLGPTQVIG